jgi:Ca-activated chloride channel family protein
MLVGLALLPVGPARADGLADWFWTPDQQGRRLYEAHDYAEAADAFADPQWRAAALFRAGRYADAADTLAPIQTAVAQTNRGTALVRGRDYQGAIAAFEAALAIDPTNATAAQNLDVTRRIVAYLSEAREAEDQQEGSEPLDDTVEDLSGDEGRPTRIDADSQLSETAADEWMRSVETKPADFLRTRFAIEAAASEPGR